MIFNRSTSAPEIDLELPLAGPLLRLRNASKFVETKAGRQPILNQVDLDVGAGDFISIMGPSGAGKSTLLNILAMFDADWSGEYEFAGHAVHSMKQKQQRELGKKYIGFVFQQYHLLDDLTVYENLEIPLSYRDVPRGERAALVADALDRFGIVAKKDLFPSQLSGGQQQLVAVARATISNPAVILADEPTGSLHSSQGRMIMELLGELNEQGTTIIQVTHSEENAEFGDRVIEIHDGRILSEAT